MDGLSALRLNLPTVFANFEAAPNIINTSNQQLFTNDIALTKVDFAHGRFSDEFIPECELVIVHAKGF